jgi:hypothetical protein
MVKIIMHNPRNRQKAHSHGEGWRAEDNWKPLPQDVYYMDEKSAKKFLDDNITKVVSVKKLN